MSEVNSILILKLGSLGDVVHTLPLANTLRDNFPHIRIGWVVEKRFSDLIEGHPSIDEVIVFDRGECLYRTFFAFIGVIRKIRSRKYEIIMDLQGNLKGSLIVFLSRCRRRMGFKRGSSRIEPVSTFFTNRKVAEDGSHIIERNLSFAVALGVEGRNISGCSPTSLRAEARAPCNDMRYQENISFKVPVLESARRHIDDFLRARNIHGRRIVIIHPGVTWVTKRWALKNYSLLVEEITEKFSNSAIVITAGPGEEALVNKIQESCKVHTVITDSMSLDVFIALLDRCEVFIASDTGPLHLAAALGKRVIGLYGPTDPVRNGPWGEENFAVWKKLSCSGCWRRRCSDVRCMSGIQISEVMEKVSICLNNGLNFSGAGNS